MCIFRWQAILTRVSAPSQKTIYNFKLVVGHTTKHMNHGRRSCDIKIWWPSVGKCSTSGSSYFNVHSIHNVRKNARCTQARKTTHGLDGQHQDVDRTLRGRVNQNDRGQGQTDKYVHGVGGQLSDRGRLKNRTECLVLHESLARICVAAVGLQVWVEGSSVNCRRLTVGWIQLLDDSRGTHGTATGRLEAEGQSYREVGPAGGR